MPKLVGKPIDRVDGWLKVTGGARYAADAPVPNVACAVIVQSTIARGRVKRIDARAAEAAAGVLAVITHENMPKLRPVQPDFAAGGKPGGGTVPGEDRMPLSDAVVHHAGQHLAVVVADTLERARHAASLVDVVYEPERPILDARDPAAAAFEPPEFFGEDLQVRRGDPHAGFEHAKLDGVVVEQTYRTPDEHHNPMEPSATVAVWEGDRLTVYDSTQWVVGAQHALEQAFGLPRGHVRVICPFVGGGFGCKGWIWPHTLLAAAAAKVVGRPVKLPLTRPQMFTSVGHRPATVQRVALAANREGQLVAMRHETTHDTSPIGTHIEACGTLTTRILYASPSLELKQTLVRLNVPTPTAMRAPGECPGTFALECAMDELAYALEIDPLELRLLNHADVDPHTGRPWSSKQLKACYRLAAEKFGWQARTPEPRSMRDGELLVGWGMATAVYPAYRFPAAARARILADGRAVVGSAAHDLGTGAYTIFTQVAADELGLPLERVTFELGDSALPPGPLAGGSNTTASVAPVVAEAARMAREKAVRLAVADPRSPLRGLAPDHVVTEDGRLRSREDPARPIRTPTSSRGPARAWSRARRAPRASARASPTRSTPSARSSAR